MEAVAVIERNIAFLQVNDKKTFLTKLYKHKILGKIELALELGLITEKQAYKYIDKVFKIYEAI